MNREYVEQASRLLLSGAWASSPHAFRSGQDAHTPLTCHEKCALLLMPKKFPVDTFPTQSQITSTSLRFVSTAGRRAASKGAALAFFQGVQSHPLTRP